MNLKIYDDSKNYTATVVKLSATFPLQGLDNVVGTSVFGNTCIIPKTYSLDELYIFFPSECKLSDVYLKGNNLYRENTLNEDIAQKGYFEENGRVKAIKFKGNKSTGVIMPLHSLKNIYTEGIDKDWSCGDIAHFKVGDEFNEFEGVEICRKYIVPSHKGEGKGSMKQGRIIDNLIDSKFFPEHQDTSQLLKNIQKIDPTKEIIITTKLHGTSERFGNTLVKRKLNWRERVAKFFGVKVVEEEYNEVVGSRRCIKSIGFNELSNKLHYYSEDLWTRVAQTYLKGKLNKGEMIYFEVVGKDYNGADIQKGYSYGFNEPTIFVYKISNITPQGIEIPLSWDQTKTRCVELGLFHVPQLFEGTVYNFLKQDIKKYNDDSGLDTLESFEKRLIEQYLDKPSMYDKSIIEEGICVRQGNDIYKLKSPLFLIHESKQNDQQVVDIESSETI